MGRFRAGSGERCRVWADFNQTYSRPTPTVFGFGYVGSGWNGLAGGLGRVGLRSVLVQARNEKRVHSIPILHDGEVESQISPAKAMDDGKENLHVVIRQ
uniref:Uncharacterized protein n=1 Tax=Lotus japonicus TaxID=34305 RepID=I3S2M9_LOTJA|nr:unknown [Lotus japonicus]